MARVNKFYVVVAILLCAFCVTVSTTHAEDYYVSGSSGNDSNPGTFASPWKTIQKANGTLQAGDTVYFRGGVYNVTVGVNPVNTGLPGAPITYSNYSGETVEFVGASDTCIAVNLNSDFGTVRSYIVVVGLRFRNFYKHMWILRGSHNEIAYCTFQGVYPRADNEVTWRGSTIYRNAQYNHIHHSVFSDFGNFYNQNDNGVLFEMGNEMATDAAPDNTEYNLLEYNEFYHGAHHVFGMHGNHNVVRHNYFDNEAWWPIGAPQWGNRILYLSGLSSYSGRNLLEGNRVALGGETSEPDQIGGSGGTFASPYNIIRGNVFDNTYIYAMNFRYYPDPAGSVGTYSEYNHVYNNTYFHSGYSTTGPLKGNWNNEYTHAIILNNEGAHVHDNIFKNNIFYDNKCTYGGALSIIKLGRTLPTLQVMSNNWLDNAGDPRFEDQVDFNLQSDSPCIDTGAFLATITSADGSGTSFVVDDAGYFMDGWGIIEADVIQLEGQPLTATVVSVDYGTNTISVDRSLSWTSGQGVSLQYVGSAPDIGAHESIWSGAATLSSPTGLRIKP